MQRIISVICGLSLLGACAGEKLGSTSSTENSERRIAPAEYTVPKQIRYSFTLRNTTDKLLPKADFWTYTPVPQTSHQWVERINATHPYRMSQDSVGNGIMQFELTNIPPYGSKIISITVGLKMSEQPTTAGVSDLERFLRAEPYIESDNTKLVELARNFKDNAAISTVMKEYDWVVGNVTAELYVPEDRGAIYAMTVRKGDCTEFAYLLTAMSRANRIPARPIGGYVFKGNTIVKAADYHNWTEFLAENRWQIADGQKRMFRKNQTEYVAMRIIASEVGGPLGNSHRFAQAGLGLEVVMN